MGGMAVLIGMLEILSRQFSNAEIGVLCHHYKRDRPILQRILRKYGVTLIKHPWYSERSNRISTLIAIALPAFFFFVKSLFVKLNAINRHKSVFGRYDVVIDSSVDGYSEYYQGWFAPFFMLFNDLCATLASKQVVVIGASIPYYNNIVLRQLAKSILNRASLITLRDHASRKNLEIMGVDKPRIEVTADLGFVMPPEKSDILNTLLNKSGVDESAILLGFNITRNNPYLAGTTTYLSYLASMIDWLIDKLDCHVIIIPSVYEVEYANDIQQLVQKVKRQENLIRIYDQDLTAGEVKGIIVRCSLVIGSMFHPCVAAVSSGVPTIAIATYGSYKFHGILGDMLKIKDYIVDFEGSDYALLDKQLKATIMKAWGNRAAIRQHLLDQSEELKQKCYLNGLLLKEAII